MENQARQRNGSPIFYALLERMANTHDRKSHDYASNDDPYGNYHFAGQVSTLFAHSHEDAGFAGRVAEKLYRLANLESSQKIPSNESIEDTEVDICTIVTLWMADRMDRRANKNVNYRDTDECANIPQGPSNPIDRLGGYRQQGAISGGLTDKDVQEKLERQVIDIAQQMTSQTLERCESYLAAFRKHWFNTIGLGQAGKSAGPFQR
jgi:hypothetical protein